MKNKKAFRFLAVLMGCLLTVTFLGNGIVHAALPPTYECGNFVYQRGYNHEAIIVDIINPTPTVTIPAFLDGYVVMDVKTHTKDAAVTRFEVEEGNLYLKAVDGVLYTRSGTQLVRAPAGYQGPLTIPQGVVSIKDNGANGCQYITQVSFPDSLVQLGDYAFNNCSGLTKVSLPGQLRYMGDRVFLDCQNLTTISLPDGVNGVGQYTFEGTAFYKDESNWDKGVLYLGNYLLYGGRFEGSSYTIRQGTKYIAPSAFQYINNAKFVIPESVERIGSNAFGKTAPNNITFPSKGIDLDLCLGYSSWATTVQNHIFSTENLTVSNNTLTIPEGTLSLAQESIQNATPFKTLYLPASVEMVSSYPYDVDSVIFEEYAIDPNNQHYTVVDGVLYTKDMKTLVSCPPGKAVVTLPEGVVTIANTAFYQNHALTKVTFSSTVRTIGRMAFASCWGLKEVELNKDLTFVWAISNMDAFYQCGDLQRLTFPENANPFPVHMGVDGILEVPAETQYIYPNYTLRRCIMQVTEPSFGLDYAKTLGFAYEIVASVEPVIPDEPVVPDKPVDQPVLPTPIVAPLGDANEDGVVNAKDAFLTIQHSVGKRTLTEKQMQLAEVTGDGEINAKDALEILKYSVEKIQLFSIQLKSN